MAWTDLCRTPSQVSQASFIRPSHLSPRCSHTARYLSTGLTSPVETTLFLSRQKPDSDLRGWRSSQSLTSFFASSNDAVSLATLRFSASKIRTARLSSKTQRELSVISPGVFFAPVALISQRALDAASESEVFVRKNRAALARNWSKCHSMLPTAALNPILSLNGARDVWSDCRTGLTLSTNRFPARRISTLYGQQFCPVAKANP